MNKSELAAKVELFRRELRQLEAIKPGCRTCEFCTTEGWCNKFSASPPPEVKEAGCEEWVYDGIPF